MIGYSVTFAALPRVAQAESEEERRARAHQYVFLTFAATVAVTIPVLLLAPEILRIFFGGDFVQATGVTRVLLVASIALGTGRVLEAVLKGVNRPLHAGLAEGAGLIVTAVGLGRPPADLGADGRRDHLPRRVFGHRLRGSAPRQPRPRDERRRAARPGIATATSV